MRNCEIARKIFCELARHFEDSYDFTGNLIEPDMIFTGAGCVWLDLPLPPLDGRYIDRKTRAPTRK